MPVKIKIKKNEPNDLNENFFVQIVYKSISNPVATDILLLTANHSLLSIIYYTATTIIDKIFYGS